MTNPSVQSTSDRMEQRTRILHHTRSKTPIVLAPTGYAKPRQPASSSAPPRRPNKAPLASLDNEFSAVVRRLAKSRDHKGSRSSSAGRHVEGSRRIVSRDVLKSDQISDWSSDDDDPSSPARSVPLRRHTMAATTRPWKKSGESSENQSESSRMSSPVEDVLGGKSGDFSKREDGMKWIRACEETPKGLSLTLPRTNHQSKKNDFSFSRTSNYSSVEFSSSNRGDQKKTTDTVISTQNLVTSPTISPPNGFLNSGHPGHSEDYSDNRQSRTAHPPQTLQLQQMHAVPTSTSSQAIHRDSVNLASPITAHDHSFSKSLQGQSISHPASPFNSRTSSQCSNPPPITSPTNSKASPSQTPTTLSNGHSWRTDPRRRPFRVSGEFQLSPGDESREGSPSARPDTQGYQPPTPTSSGYASPSSIQRSSPIVEKSPIRQNGNCGFDVQHSMSSRQAYDVHQAQQRPHHDYTNRGRVNNSYSSNSPSPDYGNTKSPMSPFPEQKYNNTSFESTRFPQHLTSPTSPCLERHNLSFDDRTLSNVRHQEMVKFSSPALHRKSPGQWHSNSLNRGNLNHQLVGKGQETKPSFNSVSNSTKSNHNHFSAGSDQVRGNDFNQIPKVAQPCRPNTSQYHPDRSLDYLEPYLGSRFSRNRDSYKLATDGGGGMCNFNFFTKEMTLANNTRNSEFSARAGGTKTVPSPPGQNGHRLYHNMSRETTLNGNHQSNSSFHNHVKNDDPFANEVLSENFVRRPKKRDSYRHATSSNPDLTAIGRDEDVFVSCESIKADVNHSNSLHASSRDKSQQNKSEFVFSSNGPVYNKHQSISRNNAHLKHYLNNADMPPKLKRNSFRLATASLSDLSVILDEIDISEPADTTISNRDSSGYPSPAITINSSTQSPLLERSLGRSGSSVSSRNSSFGSFYSCQSPAHTSAKSSPSHASHLSSPRDAKPSLGTPDSVHKLIMAKNAHDSGISQSSEDTNSYYISTNTSMCSAEDVEFGTHHNPFAGSLNRKRPMYYWTRQAPYPRHTQKTNTIPASWKPKEMPQSKSTVAGSTTRHSKPSSIRSYGSSSSVESGPSRSKQPKNVPIPNPILQRYGCGLDGMNSLACGGKGSTDSSAHRGLQINGHPQCPNGRRIPSGNQSNNIRQVSFEWDHPRRPDSLEIDFDHRSRHSSGPDSPTILESPNTLRSPPSLGRPKRKLYAGFDSQPLPMDSFMSDSSSMISISSRDTNVSCQPDSGNFDESFYSIDNRSIYEGNDRSYETTLMPQDFINLSEIRRNAELHEGCRSNSLYSTSTAKEGDGEYSDNESDVSGQAVSARGHQSSHHQVWPGASYNQSVATSLPMTFSI